MEKRIIVRSKFHAKQNLHEYDNSEWAVISILDPGQPKLFNGHDTLTLWFDDVENENFDIGPISSLVAPVPFTEAMADVIKDFVDKHSDKDFYIHCTMGKCRSGAVGEILADYFQIPWERFKLLNPQTQPNTLVRTIMKSKFLV